MRPISMTTRLLLSGLLYTPFCASAMQPLDDFDLSDIDARDGISVTFASNAGVQADQINWITDAGAAMPGQCSGGDANRHACTLLSDLSLSGVGGPMQIKTDIDVGGDDSGNAHLVLAVDWQPQRAVLGGLKFHTDALNASSQSLGQFALQSQGSIQWGNRGGLFNAGGDFGRFKLESSGDLIYRQGTAGAAELSFGNIVFDAAFTSGAAAGHAPAAGRIALNNNGIEFSAPYADVELTFDLAFKGAPADFDVTGRDHLIRFGWQGGLINALQRLGSGGFGYATYASGPNTFQDYDGSQTGMRSEGINLLSQWDFDSDFALILGEAAGNRTFVRFSDWRRFGNAPGSMFSFPVIFDVFQGGAGPTGLCAGSFTSGIPDQPSCMASGGEWLASDPPSSGDAAFGILLRDAHLHAYSSRIEVIDPIAGGTVTPINWGLVFTYGKLDADIFIRPQGRADGVAVATNDTGIRADITLLAQSPDAWRRANSSSAAVRATAGDGWRTNTHFLLADTAAPLGSGSTGVGFINGDIMYRARDLFLRVTDGDSAYPDLPGGLWLQTDSLAQYRFRGIFGGGDLADLSYAAITKVSLMDVNLQTSRFIFVLNPLPVDAGTGAAPIGFNGLLDFDGGSYITVGEVSSPQSQFFVRDVSGRIGWRDGSISIVSGQNTGDGLPQLAIRNSLDIGQSAHFGGPAGQPLIGTVGFGTENFGRIAIPAGTWSSEVIMKIPN